MNPRARRRYVLFASYAGALVLQVPLALLAERLLGGIGGVLLLIPLLAWRSVESFTSGSFADRHDELVWSVALLFYVVLFSVFVLPAHFILRDRDRTHDIALALIALGFAAIVAFAFLVRGLPI